MNYQSKQEQQQLTPARRDIAATKGNLSIDSVLATEYDGWQFDYIRTSFYLPVQVLRDGRFEVEPIIVITGSDFSRLVLDSKHMVDAEGCNFDMLEAAKLVGVSKRTIVDTGEVILIAKLWYGRI